MFKNGFLLFFFHLSSIKYNFMLFVKLFLILFNFIQNWSTYPTYVFRGTHAKKFHRSVGQ